MRLGVTGIRWCPDKVRKILDSVELHARPGDFVGIIGPNGSGKSIVKKRGGTTIAVLHDLNFAAAICDQIYVLHKGRVRAHGRPEEVLTSELLKDVFEVEALVGHHSITRKLSMVFFLMRSDQGRSMDELSTTASEGSGDCEP